MNSEVVCEKIKEFLQTSFPNPSMELTYETGLLDGWFFDSMGIVQVVIFLESAFGCNVRAMDVNADNFASIRTLSEFVVSQNPVVSA